MTYEAKVCLSKGPKQRSSHCTPGGTGYNPRYIRTRVVKTMARDPCHSAQGAIALDLKRRPASKLSTIAGPEKERPQPSVSLNSSFLSIILYHDFSHLSPYVDLARPVPDNVLRALRQEVKANRDHPAEANTKKRRMAEIKTLSGLRFPEAQVKRDAPNEKGESLAPTQTRARLREQPLQHGFLSRQGLRENCKHGHRRRYRRAQRLKRDTVERAWCAAGRNAYAFSAPLRHRSLPAFTAAAAGETFLHEQLVLSPVELSFPRPEPPSSLCCDLHLCIERARGF
ncbi:hypothetical protein MRX96_037841 [Rhipicephalus microplus]